MTGGGRAGPEIRRGQGGAGRKVYHAEGAYVGCVRRVLPVAPIGASRRRAAHHGTGRRHSGASRGCTVTRSGTRAVEDSGQCSGRSDISGFPGPPRSTRWQPRGGAQVLRLQLGGKVLPGPPDDPGGPSSSSRTGPQLEEGYNYKAFVS